MTTAPKTVSHESILTTLQAIDEYSIESTRAKLHGLPEPSISTLPHAAQEAIRAQQAESSPEAAYGDLPQPILEIIDDDKEKNTKVTDWNKDETKKTVEWAKGKKLTEDQIKDQLKPKDDASLDKMSKQLEQSRNDIANKLVQSGNNDQQTVANVQKGRAAESGAIGDHWSSIISEITNFVNLIAKAVQDAISKIEDFFVGAINKVLSVFKGLFGL
ncbi:hypothetical protein AB0467_28605 [Streptomyces sp. NPDC052095]|uniref:hypothetical protein n=1 Tax=unclassified Streptomyces TaxID=2593676 RepID=UPI00344D9778